MSFEQLASVGEFLGGLAILVSLIYLVVETRRQNETAKANATAEWMKIFFTINYETARDPILAPILIRTYDPNAVRSDFTDEEYFRFVTAARSIYVAWRGGYDLQQNGGLADDLWQVQLNTARGFLKLPLWKEWWEQDGAEAVGIEFFNLISEVQDGEAGLLHKIRTDDA